MSKKTCSRCGGKFWPGDMLNKETECIPCYRARKANVYSRQVNENRIEEFIRELRVVA
jgi:PHP family Zn ribbon phosphoesterase